MLSPLVLFVALALICLVTAFPLSDLLGATPDHNPTSATQLLSLRDGTYLAVLSSTGSIGAQRVLNPRVRTIPFESQNFVGSAIFTNIVARIRPTNNSVIWAVAINELAIPAYAAVDDTRSIFVVGSSPFTSLDNNFGFSVLRFSVEGELIWKELYTHKEFGRPIEESAIILTNPPVPFVDLAGPRTLAIAADAAFDSTVPGGIAVFVDTITRKARVARFPLPDGPNEYVESSAVATDPASGTACFADVVSRPLISLTRQLFVQCANAEGEGEVVSRVLVPYQANTVLVSLAAIMAGGGEGKAAALYVVTQAWMISEDAGMYSDEFTGVEEMLVFKLNPTTLEDMEWESGLTSMKPTMRKLSLPTSSSGSLSSVTSLEYIRDQNTLVVLYGSFAILSGIETLTDGTIAFRENSSEATERLAQYQWLLYFGNDPEPIAVRIPDDPRPDDEQDKFDLLNVADLELTEDRRGLYVFGGFITFDFLRYGEVITIPFPIPEFAQPGGESPGMGDDLGEGVDESVEPSPDETAEVIMDEEVEPSPNALDEQDT